MPVKEWFRQLQPVQLYIILALTIAFFITELVVAHVTHAITLLLDSYHTLCNIFALSACMITVKYGRQLNGTEPQQNPPPPEENVQEEVLTSNTTVCSDKIRTVQTPRHTHQEDKLKNTFGWARIDVIGMLICCVFLASLCFSIFVEALQTLIHIDHQDEMHHPISVLCIGAVGILLNGICYLVIGVLNRVVTNDSVCRGERRLSRTRTVPPPRYRQRQGFREMLRDIIGCVFVIVCALLVYFTDKNVAKYIDPVLSILSATVLMILSFPYMKESCLILLQTIPDTINIDSLRSQLLEHFPDIVNVHDLHVWQLTATKVISTAHIIFQNPVVYSKITDKVTEFFIEHGITQVTIQPEFFTKARKSGSSSELCLMKCQGEGCMTSQCCNVNEPKTLTISSSWKSISKESVPSNYVVDLKSIKVDTQELPILRLHRRKEDSMCHTDSEEVTAEIEATAHSRESAETVEVSEGNPNENEGSKHVKDCDKEPETNTDYSGSELASKI